MGAPTLFPTEADFRRWLAANHETAPELLVGFWKKSTGKPSIDWPQARDQALCFGWIDGIRKSLGEDAYTIRFTPRRKGGYRRSALGWITGAKKPETRVKRLNELIAVSTEGRRLPQYDWQKKP